MTMTIIIIIIIIIKVEDRRAWCVLVHGVTLSHTHLNKKEQEKVRISQLPEEVRKGSQSCLRR